MQIYKLIQGRIRRKLQGVDIAGGVNAVISANVNEPGAYTRVSSRQHLAERAGPSDADEEKDEKEEASR